MGPAAAAPAGRPASALGTGLLPIRAWFVGFTDFGIAEGAPRWHRLFTSKGFRHVLLVGFDVRAERWVVVDSMCGTLRVEIMTGPQVDYFLWYVAEHGQLLHWQVEQPGPWWRPTLTCVSLAKHALGLRCMALTPRQLYRWLLKHGAKRARVPRPDLERITEHFTAWDLEP